MKLGVLRCTLLLFCLACLSNGAEPPTLSSGELIYEKPTNLTGSIYSIENKQLLFKFKRTSTRSDSKLNIVRDFSYPDGKLASRESVVYQGNQLVSYQLEEFQIGAAGTAKVYQTGQDLGKARLDFDYRREAGGTPKRRSEALQGNMIVNDMVSPFLNDHWESLQRGEKLKCRYIIVPRMQTVGFTFHKDSESTWQGRDVVIIKMEASSSFVAALVDPLIFTVEKASPHRVLQYVGRTTPRLKVGGKWKDLDAVTVIDWEPTAKNLP